MHTITLLNYPSNSITGYTGFLNAINYTCMMETLLRVNIYNINSKLKQKMVYK